MAPGRQYNRCGHWRGCGEKALFRLLTWKSGSFKFLPSKVNVPHKINRSADNLIMEGLRQFDEWELLKDKFPLWMSV